MLKERLPEAGVLTTGMLSDLTRPAEKMELFWHFRFNSETGLFCVFMKRLLLTKTVMFSCRPILTITSVQIISSGMTGIRCTENL